MKKILLVEDDGVFRSEFEEYFVRRNYKVVLACDGQEGLKAISSAQNIFDLMVLDLKMPKMSGEELLRQIHQKGFKFPPIIVISGHFDRDAVSMCLHFGVKCLFRKRCAMSDIHKAAAAILSGDDFVLWSLASEPASEIKAVSFPTTVLFKLTPDLQEIVEAVDPIGSMVSKREASLRAYFLDQTNCSLQKKIDTQDSLFIVARRWNSWYPSFFDVPGGCYALISPNQEDGRRSCTIIDPGFRCLEILRNLGVSIRDIDTCVISHNHPDHLAGIFELMASRNALGLKTKGWCNKTTKDMFGDCSGFGLEMDELNVSIHSPLFTYDDYQNLKNKVVITGFPTAHREIGRSSATLGLIISCYRADNKGDHLLGKAIILGDTEYNRAQHQSFLNLLSDENVRFVVLHVGSVQEKQREGGHLYYPGLKRLLTDMESLLESKERTNHKLTVLLSEWGLEHATKAQINKICNKDLVDFDDRSPIIETAKLLNRELNTIFVLPADIGLTIEFTTGKICLPDGTNLNAEEIRPILTDIGIEYEKK